MNLGDDLNCDLQGIITMIIFTFTIIKTSALGLNLDIKAEFHITKFLPSYEISDHRHADPHSSKLGQLHGTIIRPIPMAHCQSAHSVYARSKVRNPGRIPIILKVVHTASLPSTRH